MNLTSPSNTRLTLIAPSNNNDWEPDVTVVGVDLQASAATVDVLLGQLPNRDVRRWSVVFSYQSTVYNGYVQEVEHRYDKQRLALILNA
jgi:hypothetical protein